MCLTPLYGMPAACMSMDEHAADHLLQASGRAMRWLVRVGVLGARMREPHDGVHINMDSLQQCALCENAQAA